MLAPLAPSVGEECWEQLHRADSAVVNSIFEESWPSVDDKAFSISEVTCPVQASLRILSSYFESHEFFVIIYSRTRISLRSTAKPDLQSKYPRPSQMILQKSNNLFEIRMMEKIG